jgi:hypothetical protein
MMQKKTTILINLLLSMFLLTNCSKDIEPIIGNLFGVITDYQTGEPIEDATVTITPSGDNKKTGSDGHYEFINLLAKEYSVSVSKANYRTDNKEVVVEAGKDSRLDFALRTALSQLEVDHRTLDFGNESTTLTLNIKNAGFATLEWEISEDIPWLSCNPVFGEIESEKSRGVVVNIDRKGCL